MITEPKVSCLLPTPINSNPGGTFLGWLHHPFFYFIACRSFSVDEVIFYIPLPWKSWKSWPSVLYTRRVVSAGPKGPLCPQEGRERVLCGVGWDVSPFSLGFSPWLLHLNRDHHWSRFYPKVPSGRSVKHRFLPLVTSASEVLNEGLVIIALLLFHL